MPEITVAQYADTIKVPVDVLLSQLEKAGVTVGGPDDHMTDEAKQSLLSHLRQGKTEEAAEAPKKITLKRRSQSELKMSGAQGRARTVNIEVRKKRTYVKRDVLEQQAEEQRQAFEKEREAFAASKAEEEARLEERKAERSEVLKQKQAEEEATRQAALDAAAERKAKIEAEQAAREAATAQPAAAEPTAAPKRNSGKRTRKELHVSHDKSGRRKSRKKNAPRRTSNINVESKHGFEKPTAPVVRIVDIPETIAVGELANRLAIKSNELIREFMKLGVMVTINQSVDQDTAQVVIEELGHEFNLVSSSANEETILNQEASSSEAVARPPVVTIMGHVDHGKTSLLDYIRRTKVTDGEAGGITQHIGAYQVKTDKGRICFLDTPGHAAFTAMRARGAEVTDIVVLVVAADDGVMPQTKEAVTHAKAAGVPLVVAVNKIDKEDADPDRVKNELSALEVIPEDWGGDVQFAHVSAKTGDGVDGLLEKISLQAELLELKAPVEGPAKGAVLESSLEKGRGATATVLVSSGTLNTGDMLLAGREYGRVRAMFNESGEAIKTATPSMPALVLGLSGVPNAGDEAQVVIDEKKAREVAELRQGQHRDSKLASQQAARIEEAMSQMSEGDVQIVNVLVKADVQGSAEALRQALTEIHTDEAKVKVVAAGVGGINESDANLAIASNAMIIGFNVRADSTARTAIKENGLTLSYYSVIYEAIDAVKVALEGMLAPEEKENILGLAEVREVFRVTKLGQVAGCMVLEGIMKRNLPIRVLRDNVVVFEGDLESLKRFKDDAAEVRADTECGIGVKNYNDVQVGDQIECFERVTVARKLGS